MDRRRESSRFAARDRRSKESDIFVDLKEVVPVVSEATVTHLDRIALLRVAATLCRLRNTAGNVLESSSGCSADAAPFTEDAICESLDGFVLLADADGTMLYVTESVSLYLGLTQTDLTGRSLKDFMQPNDYDEFVKCTGQLAQDASEDSTGVQSVFRMKTVISPRGRNLNLKSALFKPISFTMRAAKAKNGHVYWMQGCAVPAGQGSVNATATALTKGSDSPTGTFMTRHTCDMKISYVNDTLNYMLKNDTRSLMGQSFYELVHPADIDVFSTSMKELFTKGHTRTPYYRLLAAGGAVAWVQTEATTINHTTRGQKGQYVICIHYMLGTEHDGECAMNASSTAVGMKKIKCEIDDTRDYVGRQPQVVDCVNFTPLLASGELPVGSQAAERPARKSSYDEVLQWLFRDQPASPAPQPASQTSSWSNGSSSSGGATPDARCHSGAGSAGSGSPGDPALASAQLVGAGAAGGGGGGRGRCHSEAGAVGRGAAQQQCFSPLADGLARCELRAPACLAAAPAPLHASPPRLDAEPRRRSATLVANGASPARPTRRLSAVQQPDGFAVSAAVGGGPSQSLQRALPPPDTLPPSAEVAQAHLLATMDGQMGGVGGGVTAAAAAAAAAADLGNGGMLVDDTPFEEPDLSCLAPFVAQEELCAVNDMLPRDLQDMFPDLSEFTPAEPLVQKQPQMQMSMVDDEKVKKETMEHEGKEKSGEEEEKKEISSFDELMAMLLEEDTETPTCGQQPPPQTRVYQQQAVRRQHYVQLGAPLPKRAYPGPPQCVQQPAPSTTPAPHLPFDHAYLSSGRGGGAGGGGGGAGAGAGQGGQGGHTAQGQYHQPPPGMSYGSSADSWGVRAAACWTDPYVSGMGYGNGSRPRRI